MAEVIKKIKLTTEEKDIWNKDISDSRNYKVDNYHDAWDVNYKSYTNEWNKKHSEDTMELDSIEAFKSIYVL